MKKMQSYLLLYYILRKFYWIIHDDKNHKLLGPPVIDTYNYSDEEYFSIVVSSMDPELWEGGYPIDPAPMETWEEITCGQEIEVENLANYISQFLMYYETEIGFDLTRAKKLTNTMVDADLYADAMKYVEEMYEIYQYDD